MSPYSIDDTNATNDRKLLKHNNKIIKFSKVIINPKPLDYINITQLIDGFYIKTGVDDIQTECLSKFANHHYYNYFGGEIWLDPMNQYTMLAHLLTDEISIAKPELNFNNNGWTIAGFNQTVAYTHNEQNPNKLPLTGWTKVGTDPNLLDQPEIRLVDQYYDVNLITDYIALDGVNVINTIPFGGTYSAIGIGNWQYNKISNTKYVPNLGNLELFRIEIVFVETSTGPYAGFLLGWSVLLIINDTEITQIINSQLGDINTIPRNGWVIPSEILVLSPDLLSSDCTAPFIADKNYRN